MVSTDMWCLSEADGHNVHKFVYPGELFKCIIFGSRNQMLYDVRLGKDLIGAVDTVRDNKEFILKDDEYKNLTSYDYVAGKDSPNILATKARQTLSKFTRIKLTTRYI